MEVGRAANLGVEGSFEEGEAEPPPRYETLEGQSDRPSLVADKHRERAGSNA